MRAAPVSGRLRAVRSYASYPSIRPRRHKVTLTASCRWTRGDIETPLVLLDIRLVRCNCGYPQGGESLARPHFSSIASESLCPARKNAPGLAVPHPALRADLSRGGEAFRSGAGENRQYRSGGGVNSPFEFTCFMRLR